MAQVLSLNQQTHQRKGEHTSIDNHHPTFKQSSLLYSSIHSHNTTWAIQSIMSNK